MSTSDQPDHPTPVGSAAEANLEGRFNQIDHALTKQYWGEAWDRPDVRKRVIMDILKLTYAQGLRRGAELEKERVIARVCRHCVCSLTHQNGCQCENDE